MSRPLERLEAEALELPLQERALLAQRLLASLDDEPEEDPGEVERAWEVEIERRLAEYRAGRMEAVPAAEVLARIRDHLQRRRDASSSVTRGG